MNGNYVEKVSEGMKLLKREKKLKEKESNT